MRHKSPYIPLRFTIQTVPHAPQPFLSTQLLLQCKKLPLCKTVPFFSVSHRGSILKWLRGFACGVLQQRREQAEDSYVETLRLGRGVLKSCEQHMLGGKSCS